MILLKFNDRDDNYGDQLIFQCLENELRKYETVRFYSNAPSQREIAPLRFREAYVLALKARLFRSEQTLIFDPPGARFIRSELPDESLRKRAKDTLVTRLWKLLGARFMTTGISVDPSIEISDFSQYRIVGVRDNQSLDVLHKKGINVSYCPDMACLREPEIRHHFEGNCYLVSLRSNTPDIRDGSSFAKQVIGQLEALFCDNDTTSDLLLYSQVLEDDEFNNGLRLSFSKNNRSASFESNPPENFDYKSLFENTDIVISNRLHILLPALTEGLLAVALVSKKHLKIINFFKTHGWEHLIIYIEDENLVPRIGELKALWPKQNTVMFEQLKGLREKAQLFIESMVCDDKK